MLAQLLSSQLCVMFHNHSKIQVDVFHFDAKTVFVSLLEWKHCSVYCQTSGLYLCSGHAESCHRGGHHYHNCKLWI